MKIPSKSYGPGDKLIAKMGYPGKGPLGVRRKGLMTPISHIGRANKNIVGLGFKKKPFYLKGNSSHVIEQITPAETNNKEEDDKQLDSDDLDSFELIPYEHLSQEILDLLKDEDDLIKRINVVET